MHDPLQPLHAGLDRIAEWEARWPVFETDPSLALSAETMTEALQALAVRLEDNYPFFHPLYAGQMLKPPLALARYAYTLTMGINPNNHALDGGPATARLETEAVAQLARMFGFDNHLGHLTSSGTIANLEALWIARELHPDMGIAASEDSHYTHGRMADVLRMPCTKVPTDDLGRMRLDSLEALLAGGQIGTVVVTAGTTSIGAVDPIDRILPLARAHGVRVHVDSAYGGFYRLLAEGDRPAIDPAPWQAIAECDSIVIDPHKHGLQPYGCGCVLFRDPTVGRFYQHDSPYTYFTSDELHLGEISLECSRAGAAAAALWTTLRALPLQAQSGFGAVLRQTRQAALDWAGRLADSDLFDLVVPPALDIVTFFPRLATKTASAVSDASDRIFAALEARPEQPVYLAKLQVRPSLLAARYPDLVWDQPTMTVLRSCLMKPEHRAYVPFLHEAVEQAARDVRDTVPA
ncbi:MAG: aspartate aminotransferase family protein [Candidatus Sericytochromatia bacterium]|nr:aspartate aminotransferase family protein [Candidatus Sericytochromatia bacterium]